MVKLGQYNLLKVVKKVNFGLYLDGDQHGEILLPARYADKSTAPGDEIEVFLYLDSADRIIATTLKPKACVGECAYLKVVQTNRIGAFLDWGLPKDLLVPFSEQEKPLQKGYSYAVYIYLDEASQRIAASSRLENYLASDGGTFKAKQAVELMIYAKSDLGFKAIIDGTHLGQLYENEVFRKLHYGERLAGYIRQIRADGRIDLSLYRTAHLARGQLADEILAHLKANDGVSSLTDKSPPQDIYDTFGISKAVYKKALGLLYKNRQIKIEKDKLTLL
jgi:hypothetical protein